MFALNRFRRNCILVCNLFCNLSRFPDHFWQISFTFTVTLTRAHTPCCWDERDFRSPLPRVHAYLFDRSSIIDYCSAHAHTNPGGDWWRIWLLEGIMATFWASVTRFDSRRVILMQLKTLRFGCWITKCLCPLNFNVVRYCQNLCMFGYLLGHGGSSVKPVPFKKKQILR